MEKKPYSPPAITQHGDAVRETKGFGLVYWEAYQPKTMSDFEDPPKKDD
jgi:hypothetical protein